VATSCRRLPPDGSRSRPFNSWLVASADGEPRVLDVLDDCGEVSDLVDHAKQDPHPRLPARQSALEEGREAQRGADQRQEGLAAAAAPGVAGPEV